MARKIECISIHGVNHEMKLMQSNCPGYYQYKLTPMELGFDPKIIYIAPNRADHWLYGRPMEGKQIEPKNILYFYSYNYLPVS